MRVLALAISLSVMTFSSFASDSERIAQLEKEVQELKLRLTKIEVPQNATSNQQRSIASNDGWKLLANWRSLKKECLTKKLELFSVNPHAFKVEI